MIDAKYMYVYCIWWNFMLCNNTIFLGENPPLYSVGWPSTFSGFRFDTIVSYLLGCQTLDEWSSFSVTLFTYLFLLLVAARNAVVVLIAAVIGYTLSIQPWFNNQITLIQYDESIMPDFELPDLSVQTCQVCPCLLSPCQFMALASSGKRTCICFSWISNLTLICTLLNWIINWSARFQTG